MKFVKFTNISDNLQKVTLCQMHKFKHVHKQIVTNVTSRNHVNLKCVFPLQEQKIESRTRKDLDKINKKLLDIFIIINSFCKNG